MRLLCLGRMPYEQALDEQRRIAMGVERGEQPETLILLEHPPVVTLGRNAKSEHVLFTREALEERGVSLIRCDRGGEATFHGPGQLVAYPILRLEAGERKIRRYVSALEEVMILCCKDYGLEARRKEGLAGAWLGGDPELPGEGRWRKIGAVGVRVSRWVTTHGIALNVSVDLSYYDLINPCGMTEHPVTSLEKELGTERCPSLEEAMKRLTLHFSEVFGAEVSKG